MLRRSGQRAGRRAWALGRGRAWPACSGRTGRSQPRAWQALHPHPTHSAPRPRCAPLASWGPGRCIPAASPAAPHSLLGVTRVHLSHGHLGAFAEAGVAPRVWGAASGEVARPVHHCAGGARRGGGAGWREGAHRGACDQRVPAGEAGRRGRRGRQAGRSAGGELTPALLVDVDDLPGQAARGGGVDNLQLAGAACRAGSAGQDWLGRSAMGRRSCAARQPAGRAAPTTSAPARRSAAGGGELVGAPVRRSRSSVRSMASCARSSASRPPGSARPWVTAAK
jgi:hypothetical protein